VERQAQLEAQQRAFGELVAFLSTGRLIVPGLYIGGLLVAENDPWLDSHVDYIVNCSAKKFGYHSRYENRLWTIDIDDNPQTDAARFFGPVVARLASLITQGRQVLVHW
jgi:hypothetical protein